MLLSSFQMIQMLNWHNWQTSRDLQLDFSTQEKCAFHMYALCSLVTCACLFGEALCIF